MTDPHEPLGQQVQEEAAQELNAAERHRTSAPGAAVVLPGKGDAVAGHRHEAVVGDGDAVGIASEIAQNLGRSSERRLGVDDPVATVEGLQIGAEGGRAAQRGEPAVEDELLVSLIKMMQELAAEEPSEDTDGKEEAGPARDPPRPVQGEAPTGDQAVDMRMMLEGLAPGVQHG